MKTAWFRILLLTLTLVITAAKCDRVITDPPSLSLTPETASVTAGDAAIRFTATPKNVSGEIDWTLEPDLGTLSATTGTEISYTPPATVQNTTEVIITARLANLSAQATITISPQTNGAQLALEPATLTLRTGSAPVTFQATVTGSDDTVTWTLTGPGSLSGNSGLTVEYTPPASLSEPATATLTATLGDTAVTASAIITLTVPPAQVYVDPVTGMDSNEGTLAAPFKTLGHALSVVQRGQTVVLMAGIYDGASGETWNYQLPAGVTVQANSAGVTLVGTETQEALRFLGDGELRYLSFRGFALALRADQDEQRLTGLTFEGKRGLNWTGSATGVLQDCLIRTSEVALWVSYTSSLDIIGGQLADSRSNLILQQLSRVSIKGTEISGGTLDVNQSASLYLENVRLKDIPSYAIYVRVGQPYLSIKGGSFSNSSNQASVISANGGTVNIDGATFSGNGTAIGGTDASISVVNSSVVNNKSYGIVIGKGASLRVRNTRVAGNSSTGNAVGILISEGAGSIDLGTASEPGGNTFQSNGSTSLSVLGASGVVQAVGNTWTPNEQGANAAGHYSSRVVSPTGPYGYESGRNFYVKYPYSIQF